MTFHRRSLVIPLQAIDEDFKMHDEPTLMSNRHSMYQRTSITENDSIVFLRNERLRSNLPVLIKPAVQTVKTTSLGICFLICQNETKKVFLPSHLSCFDTLKALFVRAFPQQLTMNQMDDDNIRIYIRHIDDEIFYQLDDINEVKDRSVLKLFLLSPLNDEISGKNFETTKVKMALMEKQIRSLTEIVRDLTENQQEKSIRIRKFIDVNNQSLHQQLDELRTKTAHLREDLSQIRRIQQSLRDNVQEDFENANKTIKDKILRWTRLKRNSSIEEEEFQRYVDKSANINRELEDLEISVEQVRSDLETKRCFFSMNDVECFALALSNVSRLLVDLKVLFPQLREKLILSQKPTIVKFLREEPERLDFTIKKCKRLTTILFQLKRTIHEKERRKVKPFSVEIRDESPSRNELMKQIRSISFNSERRLIAIERCEKVRQRRFFYEKQLEKLKETKPIDVFPSNKKPEENFRFSFSSSSSDSDSAVSPRPSVSVTDL